MRSVSARLVLRFAILVSLLLGTLSVSLYFGVRETLEQAADAELRSRSRFFLDRVAGELEDHPPYFRPEFVTEMNRFLETGRAAAEVRRSDGTVLYSYGDGARTGTRGRTDTLTRATLGEIRVAMALDDRPFQDRVRRLLLYFGIFCPIAVGVSVLIGFLFVRHALAPIETIRRKAEQISRTSVSERIPEPRTTGELRDLVRTFNEMLGRLEAAMRDLESFAADAAHELRTPLATLRAEIETAVQQSRSPEEYERILESISEEVARMSRVVTDLFTLAKLDLRQFALQKERVRIVPLLDEAQETWQPAASTRGIRIRREGEDAEVLADPVALRRIFMNLVENAVKYNRPGGEVRLSVSRHNGSVRIRIADTGIGIPAEHLPRLFQRFYRVDKARSRESGGAGLGLAICRSFVECHEGKIDVASVSGEGTTFTVDLPAQASPPG